MIHTYDSTLISQTPCNGDLEMPTSIFDLGSRPKVDLTRSYCISVDASGQEKKKQPSPGLYLNSINSYKQKRILTS